MSTSADLDLRRARQAVLEAHSAAESAHDLDAVIATFHHPRYEIVPTGEVFDGGDAVRRYHAENFAGVPDFKVEPIATHHGDDAVAEEAWVSGTHLGTYHGLPPTARFVRVRVCGIYLFEHDRLVCERVYYDLLTVLRRLGRRARPRLRRGPAHDADEPPAPPGPNLRPGAAPAAALGEGGVERVAQSSRCLPRGRR